MWTNFLVTLTIPIAVLLHLERYLDDACNISVGHIHQDRTRKGCGIESGRELLQITKFCPQQESFAPNNVEVTNWYADLQAILVNTFTYSCREGLSIIYLWLDVALSELWHKLANGHVLRGLLLSVCITIFYFSILKPCVGTCWRGFLAVSSWLKGSLLKIFSSLVRKHDADSQCRESDFPLRLTDQLMLNNYCIESDEKKAHGIELDCKEPKGLNSLSSALGCPPIDGIARAECTASVNELTDEEFDNFFDFESVTTDCDDVFEAEITDETLGTGQRFAGCNEQVLTSTPRRSKGNELSFSFSLSLAELGGLKHFLRTKHDEVNRLGISVLGMLDEVPDKDPGPLDAFVSDLRQKIWRKNYLTA